MCDGRCSCHGTRCARARGPAAAPTTVSLEASAASVTVPAEIELQATTDESLYNTGYSVVIINEDAAPGTHMAACGSGTTCGASDWVTWAENPNPQPRHFGRSSGMRAQ